MTGAWTGQAGALLARAVARHGGEAAWEAVRRVTVAPRTLNGMLPSLKGVGRTFSLPGRIDVFPHESRAVFHDYPEVGQRGVRILRRQKPATAVRATDGAARIVAAAEPAQTGRANALPRMLASANDGAEAAAAAA